MSTIRKRSMKYALPDSNIRQVTESNSSLDDLLVFGYQCTLFRDDDKAMYIEEGRHLIPWMNDDSTLIDRYDGRGHLNDLKEFDAEFMKSRRVPLTEDEKSLEALCDEERYLELRTDMMQKILYEEEELKRLNEALSDSSYAAVGFNYDQPAGHQDNQAALENEMEREDEDRFVPTPAMNLPPDMVLPLTNKSHAIIEKTALFIAKHGVQMEIMMKAKQKDNPQFLFLTYENELNPYYQHLVKIIKSGKYSVQLEEKAEMSPVPSPKPVEEEKPVEEMEEIHISSQDFLHSIQSKLPAGQIANTPYAKLLSNLSRHTVKAASPAPPALPPADNDKSSLKKSASSQQLSARGSSDEEESSEHHKSSHKHTHSRRRSGRDDDDHSSGSRFSKSRSSASLQTHETKDGYSGRDHGNHMRANRSVQDSKSTPSEPESVRIIPPPPDLQPIVDKMANYVARNGPEFEVVVKSRNDARFMFIEPGHVHHSYYTHKKNMFMKEIQDAAAAAAEEQAKVKAAENDKKKLVSRSSSSDDDDDDDDEGSRVEYGPVRGPPASHSSSDDEQDNVQYGPVNKAAGVSFSIKTREEEGTSLVRSEAFQEESSDSDQNSDDESCDARFDAERQQKKELIGPMRSMPSSRSADQLSALNKSSAELKAGHQGSHDRSSGRDVERQIERKKKAALFASMLRNSSAASLKSQENQIDDGAVSRSSTPHLSCTSSTGLPSPTAALASASGTSLDDRLSAERSDVPEIIDLDDDDDDVRNDDYRSSSRSRYDDHRSRKSHKESKKHKRKHSRDEEESSSKRHKKRKHEHSHSHSSKHKKSSRSANDTLTSHRTSRSDVVRAGGREDRSYPDASTSRRYDTQTYQRNRRYDDSEEYERRSANRITARDERTNHKHSKHSKHKNTDRRRYSSESSRSSDSEDDIRRRSKYSAAASSHKKPATVTQSSSPISIDDSSSDDIIHVELSDDESSSSRS